jgi:hypothetical protein
VNKFKSLGINVLIRCSYVEIADMSMREPVRSEFSNEFDFSGLEDSPDISAKQEVVVSILIAVLGVLNVIAFYLLWLKASRG